MRWWGAGKGSGEGAQHLYLGVVLCIVLCQFRRLRHLADVVWTEPEGKKFRFRLDGTVASAFFVTGVTDN